MSIIKLRGLPWSCTNDDIVKFLNGIKIRKRQQVHDEQLNEAVASNGSDDAAASDLVIYLTMAANGKPSGEAFIELEDENDVAMALRRNNAQIGHRYIEVFRSNVEQLSKHTQESMISASNWSTPVVRLRGLPYGCVQADIFTFFDGKNLELEFHSHKNIK